LSIRVAILTVSDAGANGSRADESGPALRRVCEQEGWPVVGTALVPDDQAVIGSQIQSWADDGVAELIVTTGGTGVAARDVTPEGTRPVLERELPGVAELMRAKGLEQNPLSVLSRGLVGTRGKALVVNVPGSPAGAEFSLRAIAHLVPHVTALLRGHTEHHGLETPDRNRTSEKGSH
jgi:molybdopterin adenylyltransferase